jgi:hypothetical protein
MIEWSNQLGSRSRRAWLLVIGPGDQIEVFQGTSIPGKLVIVSDQYQQNGKWSCTTYQLELAPGVSLIEGKDGWETGTLREALSAPRWINFANVIKCTLPVAKAFLREWRPKAAAHYDKVEAELEALDNIIDSGATELTLNFGSPTRRQMVEGFWQKPVLVKLGEVEVGRVEPHAELGWSEPQVFGDVRLLDCSQSSGRGGGYVSLRIAAPEGSKLER